MGKITEWVTNNKGKTVAITTTIASAIAMVIWGLLPEKDPPVKEEWVPPVKKNWYMESDD
jgi:hypothetical protein